MSYTEICRAVEDVQKKYNERDPFKLCRLMGIILIFQSLGTAPDAIKGFFLESKRIRTITVNSDLPRAIQKIIVAHELGHYMMHRNKAEAFTDEIFFRTESKEGIEYRANEFASKLLMPEDRVRKAIAEGVRNLGQLAERFYVSSPAMKVRVQELGYKLKQNE